MNHRISPVLLFLLFLAGATLLLAFFLFLVPSGSRTSVAWLNLAVLYLLYVLPFARYGILFSDTKVFERQLPGIGLSWLAYTAYAIPSIMIMLAGLVFGIGFTGQLLLQLGALLFLLFALTMAYFSVEHVAGCGEQARKTLDHLDDIRKNFLVLSIDPTLESGPGADHRAQVLKLKDDADYLTGILSEEAAELEESILELQLLLKQQLAAGSPADQSGKTVRELATRITCRKACRTR